MEIEFACLGLNSNNRRTKEVFYIICKRFVKYTVKPDDRLGNKLSAGCELDMLYRRWCI